MMKNVSIQKIHDKVTSIKLNRPDALNAVSPALKNDLVDAFKQVSQDNTCQVIILSGEGKGFCSGLDMKSHEGIPNLDGMTMPRMTMRALEHFTDLVSIMRNTPQTIIAAVHGVAYGIGFGLALGADIRICSEDAAFNATGIVNGVSSAELGCSWLLPRLIGASQSNELMLTGRVVKASEAKDMGLISHLTPNGEVLDKAMEIAEMLLQRSHFALKLTKENLWASLEIPSLEAALQMENRTQTILAATDNLTESARALKKKETPVFTDNFRKWE